MELNMITNKTEMLELVKQKGGMLGSGNEALKADKEVVLAAVRQCPGAVDYTGKELRAQRVDLLHQVQSERRQHQPQQSMARLAANNGMFTTSPNSSDVESGELFTASQPS